MSKEEVAEAVGHLDCFYDDEIRIGIWKVGEHHSVVVFFDRCEDGTLRASQVFPGCGSACPDREFRQFLGLR
jgi:hypothetical protein